MSLPSVFLSRSVVIKKLSDMVIIIWGYELCGSMVCGAFIIRKLAKGP